MTTTPKPEPASDSVIAAFTGEIAIYRREHDGKLHCMRCYAESAGHRPGCDHAMWPSIKARIEVDRATIAKQAEEIERLRSALINLRAKCLEMGWGPEAPQLLDASAALSKPEPGR